MIKRRIQGNQTASLPDSPEHDGNTRNHETHNLFYRRFEMAKANLRKRMLQIGLCGLMMVAAMAQTSFADVPYYINFQGVMSYDHDGNTATPDTIIPDGDYVVKVELYDSETATIPLWNEMHNAVTTADGYMNFLVGGGTLDPHPTIPGELDWLTENYFDGSERWLYLYISGIGAMPRIRLTTVPYAFRAGTIDDATGGTVIGDVEVNGKLDVNGKIVTDEFRLTGGPTAGFVLTCDRFGNATWQENIPTGGLFWNLTGNTGTVSTTNFLGTTDLTPLLLKVNGKRAFKLRPSEGSTTGGLIDNSSPSIIGGHESNLISAKTNGGTIGGGGHEDNGTGSDGRNKVTGDFGTVCGGSANTAFEYSTVSGGGSNMAIGYGSTVPGGGGNTASGRYALAAGNKCVAGGDYSFAAGRDCEARSMYSFALGRHAISKHQKSFIWGNDNDSVVTTAENQFKVVASGGIEFHSDAGVRVNCTNDKLFDIPRESDFAVNGLIAAEEVVVTATGWPDYVFEDDYILRSLQQLEQEIEYNGHLPGIPSADEIESGGLAMGEMQRLMMEKIEELTLYVLQLNKEKQELQARIENLESK